MRPSILATVITAFLISDTTFASATSHRINAEGVNNYGPNDQQHGATEVTNFMNQVVSDGWTKGTFWTDANVWDSDFIDSDLQSGGGDLYEFDPNGNSSAVSYYSGHGLSDNGFPANRQICSNGNQCPASANPYNTGNGVCRFAPGRVDVYGNKFGYCNYPSDRAMILNGSTHNFGNTVDYSNWNTVAWGESPTSGAWGGAGTNGGANVVVMALSNGAQPSFYWQNLGAGFAGVHMIGTLMPTGPATCCPGSCGTGTCISGDSVTWDTRGTYFALAYHYNPSSIVSDQWNVTVLDLNVGLACGSNGVTSGGYGGYNGCGCNIMVAAGAAQSEPNIHLQENWVGIMNDSNDAQGNAWFSVKWVCNFDSNTYPFTL